MDTIWQIINNLRILDIPVITIIFIVLVFIAILALLEQEGIDLFDVNILSDTETYKNWQYSQN